MSGQTRRATPNVTMGGWILSFPSSAETGYEGGKVQVHKMVITATRIINKCFNALQNDDGPAVVLSVLGRDLVVDDATAEAGRGDAVFVGANSTTMNSPECWAAK